MESITNKNDRIVSLQPSRLGDIPSGNFKLKDKRIFFIKNISEEDIPLTVKLADNPDFIETVFYKGWNVEMVKEIKNVPLGIKLQYGY